MIPREDMGPVGTNWYGMSMQDMWEMVAGRQLTPHFTQASGWKRAGELASLHKSRLQTYREKLAQAWPPEQSDAARAYLDKLDELIVAVDDVGRIASQNHQYSTDIPAALSEAQWKLKPIREAYNKIDLAVRNGQPTDLPSGQTPERYLQGKLNEARQVMSSLSSDLSLVRVSMAPPKPYVPPTPAGKKRIDEGKDYGGIVPPVIPPVIPIGSHTAPPPVISHTLTPVPVAVGPDLTGLAPAPPAPTTTVPGQLTPIGTPPVGNPSLPGPVIGAPPISGLPGGPRPPGLPGVIGTPAPSTAGVPRGGLPPGGVIGGAPPGAGTGRGVAGARPNPVGGMIGGAQGGVPGRGAAGGVSGGGAGAGRAGTGMIGGAAGAGRGGVGGAAGAPGAGRAGIGGRGAGATGVGVGGPMGAMAGRPGQRRDGEDQDFDPDTQWAVDQGVTPVLDTPDAPGPVDPGPAIGLTR